MSDAKYNGWANYETWVYNLWIDNDQGTQEYWRERAAEIFKDAEPEYEWQTKKDAAALNLSEALQYDMDEQAEQLIPQAGPFTDILNAGLGRVDWLEIAENMIDNLEG